MNENIYHLMIFLNDCKGFGKDMLIKIIMREESSYSFKPKLKGI